MLIVQLPVHLGMATGAGCSSSSLSTSAEASASLPSCSEVSASEVSATSSGKALKRKRKVLTIEQKVEILNELSRGVSATILSERYGVGKSTVSDIKKNKDSILNFKRKVTDMGMNKKVKIMKLGDDMKHDEAVYIWLKQKRMEGTPISGPILCEKAIQLHQRMYGEESKFQASSGWQWRFCKRHGIRNLSLQGEKLSADREGGEDFITFFTEFIEEKGFNLDQIFNCDETGLNFRLLPNSTLATAFEKSADGRKKSKERVTVNACANASGTIKLPLQLIGKAKRPRCFQRVNMDLLPVQYFAQKNAWMNTDIFLEWFQDSFVPYVRKELTSLGLENKAVLVLDNCPAHPDAEYLVSDDGKIIALYLPPNVTSLIQPMDQGVLVALKRHYKRKLLRRLVIEDDNGASIPQFLKSIDMKVVVELLSESWNLIKESTFRKSWRKIIPMESPTASDDHEEIDDTDDYYDCLHEVGCDVSQEQLDVWLNSDCNDPGFLIMTDEEICETVISQSCSEEKEEEEEEDGGGVRQCPVTHSEAASMFDKCLTWLQHQPEANQYNTSTLRSLHILAAQKRTHSLKQVSLNSFFSRKS